MSKVGETNLNQELKQSWLRRGAKIFSAAAITALYVTGVTLAAPIILPAVGVTGAVRNVVNRNEKESIITAAIKGGASGLIAPLVASYGLAKDGISGSETDIKGMITGKNLTGNIKAKSSSLNNQDPRQEKSMSAQGPQPMWKRALKIAAGLGIVAGAITACVVAGPVVASAAGLAAITGGIKGYRDAGKEGKGFGGKIASAFKVAANRIISPLTTAALLINNGFTGKKTTTYSVNIFNASALKEQFSMPVSALESPAMGKKAELRPNLPQKTPEQLEKGKAIADAGMNVAKSLQAMAKLQHHASNLQATLIKTKQSKANIKGKLPPPLKPKGQGASR